MTLRTTTKSIAFRRPLLFERCRRLAADRDLRGRDRGRSDSGFIVPRLSPPIHNDDPVHSIRRRCRAAGGHDRSSGPQRGSGTRPRLNNPDELTASSPRQAGPRFLYWQCSGRNDRPLSVTNSRLFAARRFRLVAPDATVCLSAYLMHLPR